MGNAVLRKSALFFGFDPGAPAPFEFCQRDVTQRGMAPLGVVVPDVLDHRSPGLISGLEVHIVQALEALASLRPRPCGLGNPVRQRLGRHLQGACAGCNRPASFEYLLHRRIPKLQRVCTLGSNCHHGFSKGSNYQTSWRPILGGRFKLLDFYLCGDPISRVADMRVPQPAHRRRRN